jgi:hypothetical protein
MTPNANGILFGRRHHARLAVGLHAVRGALPFILHVLLEVAVATGTLVHTRGCAGITGHPMRCRSDGFVLFLMTDLTDFESHGLVLGDGRLLLPGGHTRLTRKGKKSAQRNRVNLQD